MPSKRRAILIMHPTLKAKLQGISEAAVCSAPMCSKLQLMHALADTSVLLQCLTSVTAAAADAQMHLCASTGLNCMLKPCCTPAVVKGLLQPAMPSACIT